jgi:hypothetical protein
LETYYVERDGAWVLDTEGDKRLEEFRAHNIELQKKLLAFDGIEADAVRKLMARQKEIEEAGLLKAGEVEKVIEGRVKAARVEMERALTAMTQDRDSANARLAAITIDQAVVTEATKRGLRASAITDITARARNNFRLVDGVPRALEADGRTVRVGKDGYSPLTLAEWTESLVGEAPHLFESSAGGGAPGGGPGGAAGAALHGVNPWKKDSSWNITRQWEIKKADPALAVRLEAAAR